MKAKKLLVSLDTLPLNSGSKNRLIRTLTRLKRDEDHVLFDDRAVKLVSRYERRPGSVSKIIERLNQCVSREDGLPFARSVGRYKSMELIWSKFAQSTLNDFRWNKRFQAAILKVAKRYQQRQLHPLPIPTQECEFRELLSDWGTSGGWESITSGKRTKGEILDRAYIKSFQTKIDKAIEDGRFNYPIVPGFRTQCVELPGLDCKHKKRPVNMVSLTVTLAESLFANPITTFLIHYPYSAIGKDDQTVLPNTIAKYRLRGCSWLSLDYSSYDATIPGWLLESAFDILKGMFPGMSAEQEALWNAIVRTFIVKDIVTPDTIMHVTHGNPSGSKFTSIINGVCNEIMTEYWADLLDRQVEYIIMGDDNLIFFTDHKPITKTEVERISDVLTKKIGITVNADKADYGESGVDPVFLSRKWTSGGAWRSMDELVSLLAFPERYRDYYSGHLTPELIVYSYILGCECGMRQWMYIDDFLRDYHLKLRAVSWTKELLREVPYTVRVQVELAQIGVGRKPVPLIGRSGV